MSTREPIEVADIRVGDHIRLEYTRSEDGSPRAIEYVAEFEGMGMRKRMNATEKKGAVYFPLERPKKLLYPAGTHLWLTHYFYPWEKGEQITLVEDWFEGVHYGVAKDSSSHKDTVPIDDVTDVRPTPPVVLPDTPTLGWLDGECGRMLTHWFRTRDGRVISDPLREGLRAHAVTAFTPATAIPTAALDELRKYRDQLSIDALTPALRRIDKFFRAVDAAGEGK